MAAIARLMTAKIMQQKVEPLQQEGYEGVEQRDREDSFNEEVYFMKEIEWIDENAPKPLVFRYSAPNRIKWDLVVMSLAIWNCISIPFFMAFKPDVAKSPGIMALDVIVNILFIIDILVNFRTSYMHPRTGQEISDVKEISRNYIRGGRFALDLCASLPLDTIATLAGAGDTGLNSFGLLKLTRILRLGSIILYMRTRQEVKGSMKLLQLLLFLILYIHLCGCFWYIIVDSDRVWIPTTDFITFGTDLYDQDIWHQYWYSIYHSTFLLIGAEMGPRNNEQRFISGFLILQGAFLQAVLFGEMATLMSDLNRKNAQFQEIQDTTNTTMKNMHLDEELQLHVSEYLVVSQSRLNFKDEYDTFEANLKPSLKEELQEFVYQKLYDNQLLVGETKMASWLLKKLKNKFCKPEQDLITQGEVKRKMYFVAEGKCLVKMIDVLKRERILGYIKKGKHFGELSLLYPTARTCSVSAYDYTTIAVMKESIYEEMGMKFPHMTLKLQEQATKAYSNDPNRRFFQKAFAKIPCLSEINDMLADEICYSMDIAYYNPGDFILKPGDKVDKIMIVSEGNVRISFRLSDNQLLEQIKEGRFRGGYGRELKDQLFPEETGISKTTMHLSLKSTKSIKTDTEHSISNQIDLPISDLGLGSVMNGTASLLGNIVDYTAQCSAQTVVHCIPIEMLDRLSKSNQALSVRIEEIREENRLWDNSRGEYLNISKPIDILKSFAYEPEEEQQSKKDHRTIISFKNFIVRRLINARGKKLPNISEMLVKLKAMVQAEEKGDNTLFNKIARGDVAPEAMTASEVLRDEEIDNPLLCQFSSSMLTIRDALASEGANFDEIKSTTQRNTAAINELQAEVSELKKRLRAWIRK